MIEHGSSARKKSNKRSAGKSSGWFCDTPKYHDIIESIKQKFKICAEASC